MKKRGKQKMAFMHYSGAEKWLLASWNMAELYIQLWAFKGGVIEGGLNEHACNIKEDVLEIINKGCFWRLWHSDSIRHKQHQTQAHRD